MAGIALLVPKEEMEWQAHNILQEGKYGVDYVKTVRTEDAVQEAVKASGHGADVVIARGLQATLIKHNTDIPLVEIKMTGQELGLLITQAKKIVEKQHPTVALVGFANMFCDTSYFNSIFDIDLQMFHVRGADDYERAIQEAVKAGPDIMIGGDKAVARAVKEGIPSLFLASTEDSLREAFRVAATVKFAQDIEKRNHAQMETLLDYSFSGIIQTDKDGYVKLCNPAMEKILDKPARELAGRPVGEVFPDLEESALKEVLTVGKEIYSSFTRVKDMALAVIVAPIRVEESVEGAILSCHRVRRGEKPVKGNRQDQVRKGYLVSGNFEDIQKRSSAMQKCIRRARLYAQSGRPILLTGETGTEKELMAESIHNNSFCKDGPFVAVDCGSMDDNRQQDALFREGIRADGVRKEAGAVYEASSGTLFLNNVDLLSPQCQSRLYQMLCIRISSDTPRLIAAVRGEAHAFFSQRTVRDELYYMLSGLVLEIPPLRNRQEDLAALLEQNIQCYCELYGRFHVLTAGARQAVLDYAWPGNLLQLESFCERLILTAGSRSIDQIAVKELFQELYPADRIQDDTRTIVIYKDPEAVRLAGALEKYAGNRTLAARELGISKSTLWRHMKKYGISGNPGD